MHVHILFAVIHAVYANVCSERACGYCIVFVIKLLAAFLGSRNDAGPSFFMLAFIDSTVHTFERLYFTKLLHLHMHRSFRIKGLLKMLE